MKNLVKIYTCLFVITLMFINCSSNENETVVIPIDENATLETETAKATSQGVFNVMTYNLRVDKSSDGINRWANRKENVANLILRHNPDIIGFQEDSYTHITDLDPLLTDYNWIGYGAINGVNGNESSEAKDHLNSIFYNTQRLDLLEQNVFWYADNPSAPDDAWSEGYFRMCVWAKFQEKETGKIFYHFNTHLQHNDDESVRLRQSQLLISKIHEITLGGFPVLLSGDFNTVTSSVTYEFIVNSGNQIPLVDTKNSSETAHDGTDETFFGFSARNNDGKEIDFIFQYQFKSVLFHKTINDYNDWYYPSDHCPVLTQVGLN